VSAGIDIDLARALAGALDLKLSLLPFNADENMNDDLRNMVWKGHYLGYGPADVLMHVPVDRPLMQANPQVQIFAPYCPVEGRHRVRPGPATGRVHGGRGPRVRTGVGAAGRCPLRHRAHAQPPRPA
jgi:hypothetical protein